MEYKQTTKRIGWTLPFAVSMLVWVIGMGAGFVVAAQAATMTLDGLPPLASLLDAEWAQATPSFAEQRERGQLEAVPPAANERKDADQAEASRTANPRRQITPPHTTRANQKSKSELFVFILGRNSAVYLWLLAGLLSVGAVTFMVLAYNGVQLGLSIGMALQAGMPGRLLAELLLPHGVLEVGAFFIAGAVGFQGLRLGCLSRHGWQFVKALRLGSVLVFGAGALTCAAAIEAYVTIGFLA